MPQIVKGGKYVFGWSKVNELGSIRIPEDALKEYNFFEDQKVFIMTGSKKSGGFGITSYEKLNNSRLNSILKNNPDLAQFKIKKGKVKDYKAKAYSWEQIHNNSIELSEEILNFFRINPGNFLLLVRGSNLSLGFISKGPIYEEAKKHPEIPTFKINL